MEERDYIGESIKALEKVTEKLGLPFPKEPCEMIKNTTFPQDITNLSSKELSTLLCYYTQLSSYADTIISFLDVTRTKLENEIKFEEAKSLLGSSGTVQDKKSHAVMAVYPLNVDRCNVEASFRCMKALGGGYDKYITSLSREMTRRLQEAQNIQRNVSLKND